MCSVISMRTGRSSSIVTGGRCMLGREKVTQSRYPIDVQREMRLRTKGGTVSWGFRSASIK